MTPDGAPLTYDVWLPIFQFVGFIVAAVWYLRYVDGTILHLKRPGLGTIGWIVGGFIVLFVASGAMSVVLSLLDATTAQNKVLVTGQDTPVFLLYMIPVALFLVGPGEELLFRGVVQGRLREAFGVWPGILLAAAVFGLAHWLALIGTGGGKVVYVFVAAMLGLVLGTIYEYSKNILVPIVVHGCWNALLFAANWYFIVNDVPMPT